ncbi:MAG TPA: CNNM domain-containing protein, partial [Pirellulaceae bacterium]|nr:CNNM domain-containing protein [Pirellulaceae bacterium]
MSLTVLLIILAMLLLNGIFAAYELALASVRAERLKHMVEQRRRGAVIALRMKNRMEASLAVVQLGITLVGAIAAATGGADAKDKLVPLIKDQLGLSPHLANIVALTCLVIPLAAITIIVGELIPKVFALKNSELVVTLLSPLMW